MSRTTDAIEWLTPFHEAAEGRTGGALDLAIAQLDGAPEEVHRLIDREGLRVLLHALRRSSGIRLNGDAETMPLFVAIEDTDGVVVHRPRLLVRVIEIERQLERWGKRRSEAAKELSWWSHQAELANTAKAEPDETLRTVWDRLGLSYTLFIGSADESVA